MSYSEQVYRISYYAGVQTVRLFHRMGRFLTLLFLPLRLLLRRVGNHIRRQRSLRIREGFAGLRRRFSQVGGRVRAAWKRHPLIGILQVLYLPIHALRHYRGFTRTMAGVMAGVVAIAILGGTLYYWSDTTFALALTDDSGEVWGYVTDESVLQQGAAMAKERLGEIPGANGVAVSSKVSLQIVPQANIWNRTEVCDYLMENAGIATQEACGIYIDGVLHGTVGNSKTAERVLDAILEESREDNDEVEASFVETVELIDGIYPSSAVISGDELKTRLTTVTEEKIHTVQAGDTLLSITTKYDITVVELKKRNPDMGLELHPGDKLVITEKEQHLRVQVSGTVTYDVEIPYTVTRIPDASMYEGNEKVQVEGRNGISRVTATVTYLNGVEQFSVITDSEIIEAPVMGVVAYGTKRKSNNNTGYNGKFLWPTPSTKFVTQQYGSDGHRGIDIWREGMEGDDILAVDDGTVIMAGEYAGYKTYGKFIIIDHGQGFRTVYAHCSKVFVKEGDVVKRGDVIALVGNTGRSTAPHLHLEVQRNGVLQNPMKFF